MLICTRIKPDFFFTAEDEMRNLKFVGSRRPQKARRGTPSTLKDREEGSTADSPSIPSVSVIDTTREYFPVGHISSLSSVTA